MSSVLATWNPRSLNQESQAYEPINTGPVVDEIEMTETRDLWVPPETLDAILRIS